MSNKSDQYVIYLKQCFLSIESKHLAVELSIATTHTDVAVKGTANKAFSFVKYKWDEEKSTSFSCMMQTEHAQALMNEATSLINCDINQALSKFNECFEHTGECMKRNNIYWA